MRTRTIFLLLATLLLPPLSHAQWTYTNGPLGPTRYNALSSRGEDIFVGTSGGVLLSTDNGNRWTLANIGLTIAAINAIQIKDSMTLVGTPGGVFLSIDNGASWQRSGLDGKLVSALSVSGEKLFAGIMFVKTYGGPLEPGVASTSLSKHTANSDCGAFVSTDNGRSWKQVLDSCFVYCFAVSGQNIFAGTTNGLLRSTDDGISWKHAGLEGYVYKLAVSGTNLFAAITHGGGISRSTDNGMTWMSANSDLPGNWPFVPAVTAMAASAGNIFAGISGHGVFLSPDNGTSWKNVGFDSCDVYTLAVSGSSLFAGSSTGLFRSTDSGTNWVQLDSAVRNSSVLALEALPNGTGGTTVIAGTDMNGIFLSTDNGGIWMQTSLTDAYSGSLKRVGPNVFACTPGAVYVSTDGGAHWNQSGIFTGASCLAVSGSSLFVGGGLYDPKSLGKFTGFVYRTTDLGNSWEKIFEGEGYVVALAANGLNLYAARFGDMGAGYGVSLSTNNGASWTAVNSGLPPQSIVPCFAVSGTDIFAFAYNYECGERTPHGIFRSTDSGTSWTPAGLSDEWVTCLSVIGHNLFAGTQSGVFFTTNSGSLWIADSSGLWNKPKDINALLATDSTLFVGASRQLVCHRPMSDMITSAAPLLNGTLCGFELAQNYPNPFNPSSDIRYQISEFRHVKLAVYDLLGQEVAVLVNERKAPGSYEVTFDGSTLASGMYLYRLQSGSYVETKKMLILK